MAILGGVYVFFVLTKRYIWKYPKYLSKRVIIRATTCPSRKRADETICDVCIIYVCRCCFHCCCSEVLAQSSQLLSDHIILYYLKMSTIFIYIIPIMSSFKIYYYSFFYLYIFFIMST